MQESLAVSQKLSKERMRSEIMQQIQACTTNLKGETDEDMIELWTGERSRAISKLKSLN